MTVVAYLPTHTHHLARPDYSTTMCGRPLPRSAYDPDNQWTQLCAQTPTCRSCIHASSSFPIRQAVAAGISTTTVRAKRPVSPSPNRQCTHDPDPIYPDHPYRITYRSVISHD